MTRYTVESFTDDDTRIIRYVIVDRITGHVIDARDFDHATADFGSAKAARAMIDQWVIDGFAA